MRTKPNRRPWFSAIVSLGLALSLSACGEWFDNLFSPTPMPTRTPSGLPSTDPIPTDAGLPHAKLRPVGGQSGQVDADADMQTVSLEYEASLPTNSSPVSGSTALVGLPLATGDLPTGLTDAQQSAQWQPEVWNPEHKAWEATGQFAWYEQESGTLWFRDQLTAATGFETQQQSGASRRFRVRIYLFSNLRTVTREDSHFRIHYYPTHLANPNRVIADADWGSPGRSDAPEIPDFIEDLDAALTQAYSALLRLQSHSGNVFEALPIQDVYVMDTGTSAGDSRLGGPLRISNRRIEGLLDLRLVAAHELVHVFQGQYYSMQGLFSGRSNHAFIEALANAYAAHAVGLGDEAKKNFFGEYYADYLSVPLNASLDNSMYAAGHFLDWLAQRYGVECLGDTLNLSSGNDFTALSQALDQHAGVRLSTAYVDYVREMLTRPEGTAGFHAKVRDAMGFHALGYRYLSANLLNDKRNYVTLNKTLGVYSSVLAALRFGNTDDALLVVDNHDSKGALLKAASYGLESDRDADFAALTPLEGSASDDVRKQLLLPHVGEKAAVTHFNHLLTNASPASGATVATRFYLLRPPVISDQDTDSLSWSLASLGNLPHEQIKGFRIYREDARGQRTELLELQPVAWGKTEQSVKIAANRFGTDQPLVTVVDKYGNEWPAAEEPALEERICTAAFRLKDDSNQSPYLGLTDHFVGQWSATGFSAEQMWCPPGNACRWGPGEFESYKNHMRFSLTDQGQALENLSLRVDPGNGYFESLTYAGRIPRVKTGAQQVYQISGSEACRDVVYSAGHPRINGYNSYDSTACNASSYLRVVCEADYPGRDFSYDYH